MRLSRRLLSRGGKQIQTHRRSSQPSGDGSVVWIVARRRSKFSSFSYPGTTAATGTPAACVLANSPIPSFSLSLSPAGCGARLRLKLRRQVSRELEAAILAAGYTVEVLRPPMSPRTTRIMTSCETAVSFPARKGARALSNLLASALLAGP